MRLRTTATLAYLLAFVAMGVSTMLLGPSIDALRHSVHATPASIGILFTASSIGYLIGVALAGQLIVAHSGHAVLRFGLVVMATSVVALPFGRSLPTLFALQIAIGFGIGCIEIPCNSLVLWASGGGAALNALHASFALGAVCAPLLVGRSLAWTDGLKTGYVVAAAVALVPLVCLGRRPSPPNPHKAHGRGIPGGARLLTALGAIWFFAYVGVEVSFAGWIYKYAQAHHVANAQQSTFVGAGFLAAFAVGRVAGVPIARRWSAIQMLAIDHVLAALALGGLLVGGNNAVIIWSATIVFGLGVASMFAAMLSLSDHLVPATGTITSVYLVGSSFGAMLLPSTMGGLIERFGAIALPIECLIGLALTASAVIAFQRIGAR